MISRQLSFSDNMNEHLLASGAEIKNEGAVLVGVLEDNVEKVKLSEGKEGEKVVGFAWSNSIVPGTAVAQKTETADDAYETGVFAVALENAIEGTVRATKEDGTAVAGTLADGVFTINEAVEAGDTFVITYRKNLTVAEQTALFGNARPNLANNNLALGSISVIRGNGEIATDQFDTSADWSEATEVSAGANGLLVPAGKGGKAVIGRITAKPSAGFQWLRVAFNLA